MAAVSLVALLAIALTALNRAGAELGLAQAELSTTAEVSAPEPADVVPMPVVADEPEVEPAAPDSISSDSAAVRDVTVTEDVALAASEPTEEQPIDDVESAPPTISVDPDLGEPAIVRWASTWVNVRERRGVAAPVVTVLDPGQRVEIEQAVGGWSLVRLSGEPVGYVYNAFLSTTPGGI